MKTGIELITEERNEQLEKHGWSSEHDDQHTDESLKQAAIFMLTKNLYDAPNWDKKWIDKLRYKGRTDSLKIAGALIAAEIDRLQRLKSVDVGN